MDQRARTDNMEARSVGREPWAAKDVLRCGHRMHADIQRGVSPAVAWNTGTDAVGLERAAQRLEIAGLHDAVSTAANDQNQSAETSA